MPAILRTEEEAQRLQMALVENMAREDLNPIEEARACAALVEELALSKEDVARRVGRSRSTISNLIRLLDLPDQVARAARVGRAQRGARPRAARRQGPGRAPPARPRGRRRRLVGPRDRAPGQGGGGGGPKLQGACPHPDEEAAIGKAEDALERALGRDVRVSAGKRGLTAQIRFEDLDELLSLAELAAPR